MGLSVLKLLLTGGIVAAGLMLAWVYVRKPNLDSNVRSLTDCGQRPWRRIGGAICLLLAIMFPVGAFVVDIPDHPRAYAAYWVLIMALVLWLGVLAIKDVLYTREMMKRLRSATSESIRFKVDDYEVAERESHS